MIAFIAATDSSCRAPVIMADNPPGPDMWICGEAAKPGSAYCPECHTRFYYKPTTRALKAMDYMAGKPLRMGRG
ncbi:hypothetical protein [Rhizobium phaseoli]|uniref:hypothetical protein n=1 Tax=Rhizobium phaseoli TaxID=396 RepID=UPI0025538B72|nr:hypothetical protein [Rhizobium phaseoli]MDK4729370.1 hypothetical protein [Rhizobium phaseoli]